MKSDLLNENFLNLQHIIPKEVMADYFNGNYKLDIPVRPHGGFTELNIVIDME